jgi:UDP-glucuronate decarboxylase
MAFVWEGQMHIGSVKAFDPQFDLVFTNAVKIPKVVLIPGGAGFIGSNLCARLVEQGDYVICLDNLLTGRMSNIAPLLMHPRFRFFRHDIIDPFEITGPVMRIYNLASPASPPKYQKDPIHTFKTSVLGAMNLLDLARAKGARILQSSTSEVYGDPEVVPQPESYRGLVNTVGPRSCYDEGKRAAETLFHEMHQQHGVDIRIARIFNTYGPKMDPEDGRVISNFIVQSLRGQALTIYGDGSQTRAFCYVDDMLDGLMSLMEVETVGAGPVNLGNPGEFTIADLAGKVLALTGNAAGVEYHDLPIDDPRRRRPDITRARNLLGWAPKVALEQGLRATVDYFRTEIDAEGLTHTRMI